MCITLPRYLPEPGWHHNQTGYDMNLAQELTLRTSNSSLKDIARAMGYSSRNLAPAAARIHKVITDDKLGLGGGGYDFKYTNTEFVLTLCRVLGLDSVDCSAEIDAIVAELDEYRQRYHPWLFVDTGFKRTTQPIFALAFMEGRRRIDLSKDLLILPMDKQVEQVGRLIRQHYQKSEGKLDLWGAIQGYKYFYDTDQFISFDTCGVVVDTGEAKAPPSATLTIGGADVTTVLKPAK